LEQQVVMSFEIDGDSMKDFEEFCMDVGLSSFSDGVLGYKQGFSRGELKR